MLGFYSRAMLRRASSASRLVLGSKLETFCKSVIFFQRPCSFSMRCKTRICIFCARIFFSLVRSSLDVINHIETWTLSWLAALESRKVSPVHPSLLVPFSIELWWTQHSLSMASPITFQLFQKGLCRSIAFRNHPTQKPSAAQQHFEM